MTWPTTPGTSGRLSGPASSSSGSARPRPVRGGVGGAIALQHNALSYQDSKQVGVRSYMDKTSVVDPFGFDADPDLVFQIDADPDPDPGSKHYIDWGCIRLQLYTLHRPGVYMSPALYTT